MFLADGGSPHTIKWARSLASEGYEILIFGLSSFSSELYKNEKNITAVSFGIDEATMKSGNGSLRKLRYLSAVFKVRSLIKEFKPDILHVHFVSSYGLIASLVGFKRTFMSVWGADVYDFPLKSQLHQRLLEFVLSKADSIFSTSHVMAKQASKFTDKKIEVIPFGIDLQRFRSFHPPERIWSEDNLVIGTVKSLEDKYGISDLIKAFALIKNKRNQSNIKLLIVGKGTKEIELKSLVETLGIAGSVHFTGWIPVEQIPDFHNMLDISVFPSILDSESFGVAVVEASASEKPVIVTKVGGLVEVVEDNVTGIVVPPQDPEALAQAIEKLIDSKELRLSLGQAGRKRVEKFYDWSDNLNKMKSFYT